MKYLFSIIFLVFSILGITGQTVIPTGALRGEITNIATVSAGVYLVSINVQDYSGKINGTFVTEDSTWVVWQNCKRFIVTNIDCGSCSLLNSEITVEISDVNSDGSPGFGFVSINEENELGVSGFASQTDDDLYQCINLYYLDKLRLAIDTASGGFGNYKFITTDSFSTFIPAAPAPAIGETVWRTTTGNLWQKTGASTWTRRSLENGGNASMVLNVSNDTLTFNANLYNHVRLSTGNVATAYVQSPTNISSQFIGETFLIGIGSGTSAVTVSWDTLYGTFDFGNMPNVVIPANSIVNYTFRVVSEGGEGIRLQWIDGGQNTEVAFNSNRAILRVPTVGTNIGGSTVTDFLNWYYFVAPTLSLTLSPTTTVYEVGTSNAITLNGTTTNPASTTLSLGAIQTTVPSTTSIHSFADSTSTTFGITFTPQQGGSGAYNEFVYTFRTTQTYSGSESGTVNSSTRTINGVYPVLYGMSATDFTSTGNPYTGLTKLVEAEGNKTVSLTGSGFIYFLVPKTWSDWNLSSIIDHNGFNVTASFTATDININSSGLTNNWTTQAYRMYKLNTTTTTSGNAYQFNR